MAVNKPYAFPVPSNYDKVKEMRGRKDLKLNECKYLKPTTRLRYYQTVGSLNMLLSTRTLLGDSPGLGKTVQTVATQAIIKSKMPSFKFLVVSTKSSLKQWGREIEKFSTGLTYHVLVPAYRPIGATKQVTGYEARKAQYKDFKDVDILITGYHPVKEDHELLVECRGPDFMVVFDECQEFKNDETAAHIGAKYIADHAKRVVGLSATPIKNRLMEMYHIMEVLVPGLFPNITRFKDYFCLQQLRPIPTKGGGTRLVKQVVGYKNLELFKQVIAPYFLARPTHEVSDELPKLVARRVEVEMSAAQKKLYAEALSGVIYQKRVRQRYFEYRDELEKMGTRPTDKQLEQLEILEGKYEESLIEGSMASNKGAALTYCQLIANGPEWLGEEGVGGSSTKEEEFERLVVDELASEKIIVYTRFESGIDRLSAILAKHGIKFVRVSGKENGKKRQEAMDKFQDPEGDTRVIFITNAGSAAINLQAASVEIFFDTPWSFGDLCQTIGRAQRIGSLHTQVLVIHMVTTGTLDEHVLDVLAEKKWLTDQIMGDIAMGALNFEAQDLEEAEFSIEASNPDEVAFEDTSDVNALFSRVFGGLLKK